MFTDMIMIMIINISASCSLIELFGFPRVQIDSNSKSALQSYTPIDVFLSSTFSYSMTSYCFNELGWSYVCKTEEQ